MSVIEFQRENALANHNVYMYDATPAGVPFIPSNAQVVAGYVDGNYISFPELVSRFPHSRHVSIGVFFGHLGDFTDVEPGNPINTPELIAQDYHFRRTHGVWRPGYYADQTRMTETVLPGLKLAGASPAEYRLWLADWDGNPDNLARYDAAKQYTSGSHYDLSVVDTTRMFPPPPPLPPHPKPAPQEQTPRAIVEYDPDRLSWKVTNYPWGHEPVPAKHKRAAALVTLHPKVSTSGAVGGLSTLVQGVLHSLGVIHFTPAETSAVTAILAFIAGYLAPGGTQA